MPPLKLFLVAAAALCASVVAAADPVPYASLPDAHPTPPPGAVTGASASDTGATPSHGSEPARLRDALEAAKSGDTDHARAVQATLADPLARRIVTWALVDSDATRLGYFDLDAARRDLSGWPRSSRREQATERALETSGLSPSATIAFFDGREPETAEGAMALASAYQSLGRQGEAQALIRHFWRDRPFEADVQARMLGRWGSILTADDNARRLDILLYGQQGPAARAMMDLAPPDQLAEAQARLALRDDRNDAPAYVERVPAALQNDPGLAFERARYYRKRNLETVAVPLLRYLPRNLPPEVASEIWPERRALMMAALRTGDLADAHQAAAQHGLAPGADFAEAEFFAGWIDLKTHDAREADEHFARLASIGASPITLSRAFYWRGRAAEARGDSAAANGYYAQGARFITAFYGQLAAEKIGRTTLSLPADPQPTAADRERFEGRDLVRAARMLADAGERDTFRVFVLGADDTLPSAEEYALLSDLAKQYGDQDLAMRVARAGAQRGFLLPERGYPIRMPPAGGGLPEPAFSLAIIRQESNFDPAQRSGPGARGLMQVMPSTAEAIARRIGLRFSSSRLNDPDYNMQLGTAILQQTLDDEGGSYLLTAAAYNAGPGRAAQWVAACGDPRGASTDPTDFIECISIAETRNYVMRILETTEVYRARLAGGSAPLTLTADLRRGGWTPGGSTPGLAPQPYVASPSPYFPGTAPAAGPALATPPARR
jgi:soluble lytic murein transglycosylase